MKKMKMTDMVVKDENLKRKHCVSVHLNEYELQAVKKYCKKYRVKNKSKFLRETFITVILKKFDEDYPSLFEQDNN